MLLNIVGSRREKNLVDRNSNLLVHDRLRRRTNESPLRQSEKQLRRKEGGREGRGIAHILERNVIWEERKERERGRIERILPSFPLHLSLSAVLVPPSPSI